MFFTSNFASSDSFQPINCYIIHMISVTVERYIIIIVGFIICAKLWSSNIWSIDCAVDFSFL